MGYGNAWPLGAADFSLLGLGGGIGVDVVITAAAAVGALGPDGRANHLGRFFITQQHKCGIDRVPEISPEDQRNS